MGNNISNKLRAKLIKNTDMSVEFLVASWILIVLYVFLYSVYGKVLPVVGWLEYLYIYLICWICCNQLNTVILHDLKAHSSAWRIPCWSAMKFIHSFCELFKDVPYFSAYSYWWALSFCCNVVFLLKNDFVCFYFCNLMWWKRKNSFLIKDHESMHQRMVDFQRL